MSIVFSIRTDSVPSPNAIVDTLTPCQEHVNCMSEATILVCPEATEFGGDEWEMNQSYTFYYSNVSTRGLEVWHDGKEFFVRVLTMSCPEEFELAYQILELAAGDEDEIVFTDWERTEVPVCELRDEFDERAIMRALFGQVQQIFEMAADGQVIEIGGPIRSYHIGPWLMDRILACYEDPGNSLWDIANFLFDLIRLVQYFFVQPKFDGYEMAPVMELEPDETDDDDFIKLASVIGPDRAYYVPKVEYLMIGDYKTGGLIALPSECFKDQLPLFFKEPEELLWLDEYQFAIAPISEFTYRRFATQVASFCAIVSPT